MRSRQVIIGLFLITFSVLSSATTVRLITIGPGDAFWSVYGHTALAIDEDVYGFGYFDFADDNLIKAFIANDMQYTMGVSSFADELYYAKYYERQFKVQELDLSPLAVSRLQQSLANHYLPENRQYQYDYLINNCATKIRDLLNEATDGALYKRTQQTSNHRYIDLTVPAYHQSTMSLGLALGYGLKAYEPISDWQAMAFPLALERIMNQRMSDFIKSERTLYTPPKGSWSGLKNYTVLWGLVLILMTAFIPAVRMFVINGWFWILSTVGIVLLYLWLFSAHPIAVVNFNVLLANPLLFLTSFKSTSRLICILLLIGQLLWVLAAIIWSAWYLMPLAVINIIFLYITVNRRPIKK